MTDELLNELNRIADGIWSQRKKLNHEKIERIDYLYVSGFSNQFDRALENWLKVRKTDLKNIDHSLEKILGVDSTKDYWDAYHKFFEVVTIAKSKDLIIDNEIMKELDDCRKKRNELDQAVKQQENIISTYTKQIENVLKAFPHLKQYFGISESEVEKNG